MGNEVSAVVIGSLDEFGLGDLTGEVARAKAALLYADTVTITSFRPSLLLARAVAHAKRTPIYHSALHDHPPSRELGEAMYAEIISMTGAPEREILRPILEQVREGDIAAALQIPEAIAEATRTGRLRPRDPARLFASTVEETVRMWAGADAEVPPTATRAAADLVTLVNSRAVQVAVQPMDALIAAPLEDIEHLLDGLVDLIVQIIEESSQVSYPVIADTARLSLQTSSTHVPAIRGRNDNRVALAARLISDIPNLADLPADEVLAIRTDVAPHVARFRAAIAELEEALEAGVGDADFEEAVSEVKMRVVDPEMEALRQALHDVGALAAVARATPLTATGVVSLAVSAAMGGPALAGAAAVAAGFTTAVAKEYLLRREVLKDRQKHRLFLLLRAERAAAHRK